MPTGHSHDDDDAAFSAVAKCCEGHTIETVDKYKTLIEDKLGKSRLKVSIEDVMIIPAYSQFLEDSIGELKHLHKEEETQHQWLFAAVEPSLNFPHGVKVTYRAYCSEKVIELNLHPKEQCVTPMGIITGLEPTTVHVRWYPSKDCDPSRPGVEGAYLLKKIPSGVKNESGALTLPAHPLAPETRERIFSCLSEVRTFFRYENHKTIRESWDRWAQLWSPESDEINDYLSQLNRNGIFYKIPLKLMILDVNYILPPSSNWRTKIKDADELNAHFSYPSVLAASMNSVLTQFNPRPAQPRLYVTTDDQLEANIASFNTKVQGYYLNTLLDMTKKDIDAKAKYMIDYNGEALSLTGIFNLA
ncbi:MAG: hypothetical protein HKL80_03770 [Acidimicrobiales bacterium]|nr:hypothetical protein [Acidimicrobiales bacterium]